MQSSSRLFPVALLSAELLGDLSEDVYRLKPGNSPDPSVELALTRLGRAGQVAAVPVVLLHGSFSNRRFWYSPAGIGPGAYLARMGFDVWIAEMRGHGLSPRNPGYSRNRVADYAAWDLPAIAAFIHEQTGQPAHWLGHSLGGATLLAALGGGYLPPAAVRSATVLGTQLGHAPRLLKLPPVVWAAHALLAGFTHVSGLRFRRGPEDEPIATVLEHLRWHAWWGRFGDARGDWLQGLAGVELPVLAVAAAADRQSPPAACRRLWQHLRQADRHFLLLSQAQGFASDYGHLQMLHGKDAQREVWPLLADWLKTGTLPQQTLQE